MSFKTNPENINKNGRKKGSVNIEKQNIKDFVQSLISENTELILKDFVQIEPKERLKIFSELLKFLLPTAKEVHIEEKKEPENTIIDVSKLSTELLELLDKELSTLQKTD